MTMPSHAILTDEGYLLWQAHPGNIHNEPLFEQDIGMWREAGIIAILTTNHTDLSPAIRANLHAQVILNVAGGDETTEVARVLGLNREQRQYLERNLTRGEALVLFSDGWRYPIHLRISPNPMSKAVSNADWDRARQRLNQLLPPPPPPAAPPAPVVPARVALSASDEALLTAAADGPDTTLALYEKARVARQSGDRSKSRLATLGLLVAEKAMLKPGRGGTGILLAPSPAGYAWLGRTPPRTTRGGDGLAHRFFVRQLAGLIPESTPEFQLGNGKSVDLFLRVDAARHEHLLKNLARYTQSPPKHDDLIAIEVEISDPGKTAPSNVVRNHEAGLTNTIIAVLPGALDEIKHLLDELPPDLRAHAVTVDLLAFAEGLRHTP